MTLQEMMLRTESMMEQMRQKAIEKTWEEFRETVRNYYQTSKDGDKVTKLIRELESLGVPSDEITDADFAIYDEIFGTKA